MQVIDEAEGLFRDTCDEVNSYFQFLKDAIEKSPTLHFGDEAREFDSGVINTMKASAYMMLYNLIEATTDKIFEALHEDIAQTSFDDLLPKLQYHLLRSFKTMKKDVTPALMPSPTPIATIIHQAALENIKLFSGNIDARKIRETAEKYGLTVNSNTPPQSERQLLSVKTIRNQIGHGEKSFSEVGKSTSIEELIETKEKVIDYLDALLVNAQVYLDQQHYRHTPLHAPETIVQSPHPV